MTPILETERLILRRPSGDDWPRVREFMLDERAAYVGGHTDEGKAFRAHAALIGHWEMRGYGMFAIVPRGETKAIGHVGHWNPAGWPERELGWHIFRPQDEGRGLAAEAARKVIDYTFQVLNWDTLVSYIDPRNARSIALAERLGATRDDAATPPDPTDPCLVYRHPRSA